jgi:hypothetical protein
VMQAAVVGMANAIGQIFNAFRQTPSWCIPIAPISRAAPDVMASRRPRTRADRPADHQVHVAGAPGRHDPGNHPSCFKAA